MSQQQHRVELERDWDSPESFVGSRMAHYGYEFDVDAARGDSEATGEVRDAASGDWYALNDVSVALPQTTTRKEQG